ncbi:hypothetical protein NPIL_632751, partial [Nephila pilipes]
SSEEGNCGGQNN